MRVTVWSDYICPWCYLALDREELLGTLGVDVVIRPFELHPSIPATGREHPPGGRISEALARVGAECRAAGLPFESPLRSPNSRRALATAEQVRIHQPDAFSSLHRSLFDAHFAAGLDIGDPTVLDELVGGAGADPDPVRRTIETGEAWDALDRSIEEARSAGVTATPAFAFLDHDLVVPGVQPRETLSRWVERLRSRAPAGDT